MYGGACVRELACAAAVIGARLQQQHAAAACYAVQTVWRLAWQLWLQSPPGSGGRVACSAHDTSYHNASTAIVFNQLTQVAGVRHSIKHHLPLHVAIEPPEACVRQGKHNIIGFI